MRICKGLELLGIMSHGLSEPRHEKEPGLGAKYLIRLVAGRGFEPLTFRL